MTAPAVVDKSVQEARDVIANLQTALLGMEQLVMEPVHHFSGGLYARELTLPKGSTVIGKIHKHAHLNVVLRGHVTVTTPFGTEDIKGPCIFESKPDTKRAVYAHEETVWLTFHPTDETDVDEIEKQIILPDYSDKLALENT
tara:strand:+ start:9002 stop:9427 length:426 start_codon:yes stop_codon:yes gene_type:complete